jgi:hypothetical protein
MVGARHIQMDSDVICVGNTAFIHFPLYCRFNKTTQYLFMQGNIIVPYLGEQTERISIPSTL